MFLSSFHSLVRGKSKTLTIYRSENSNVFGGYTDLSWDGSNNYRSDSNAFIFSLENKNNTSLLIRPSSYNNRYTYQSYHDTYDGLDTLSSFGSSDLRVCSNADILLCSSSNLGQSYSFNQNKYGSNSAQTFLAGSYNFYLNEIEVYQKIF